MNCIGIGFRLTDMANGKRYGAFLPHALGADYVGVCMPTVIFVLKGAGGCFCVAVFSYFYTVIKFTLTIKEVGL